MKIKTIKPEPIKPDIQITLSWKEAETIKLMLHNAELIQACRTYPTLYKARNELSRLFNQLDIMATYHEDAF